jgi:TatD DNase family protein
MQFDIHTHHPIKSLLSIYNGIHPDVHDFPFSFGVHPWKADELVPDSLAWQTILNHPNCVALGEIGLDALKGPELSVQMDTFIHQIEFSENYRLPVIIHCVRAFEELIQLKRLLEPAQPWIVHGFEKTSYLFRLLETGFYISVGHRVLSNEKLQSILPQIPLERLFLETDESNIKIDVIYDHVAQLLHLPVHQLEKQIEENIKRTFPKWKIG